MSKRKTELAEKRTVYADDRTAMVHERIMAGRLKLGLSFLAAEMGLVAYLQSQTDAQDLKIGAIVLAVATVVTSVDAFRRARLDAKSNENSNLPLSPHRTVAFTAFVLTAVAGWLLTLV